MSMKVKENLTIPNILSTIRILMIPFVVIAYFMQNYILAIVLLALSGLTDVADGFIARHFHQISDLGKILDPIADKLTQFTVVVCLAIDHHWLIPVAILFAIKEILTLIGAVIFVRRGNATPYARWWGKMTTVVLYITMGLCLLRDYLPSIPPEVTTVAVTLTIACLLFSFYNYLQVYLHGRRKTAESPTGEEQPAEPSEK